jgi:anaerobic selenocysteine-containing dehydrogenase
MSRIPIRGACPHDCPDTCGVITEVEDGRAVGFRGDPAHPVTRGWLCAKVRPYLDHVYHPDRVLYPLRRMSGKGERKWARITWPDALGEIGERWRRIIRESGPEAILPYSYSGTLGLVQMVVASGRFWNRLGASRLERSICGAAAELAVEATLGKRWSAPYEDVLNSRLVILWGHNPVSTAPHYLPHLRKAQRQGCQLVVIDPRRSASAAGADLHLAPRPGTDGVLALGIAHLLVRENKHDEEWLNRHTVGWDRLRPRLEEFPLERVARETGLTESEILHLARLYAKVRPSVIKFADGINRNFNGGQNVRALCLLPALTGQYGVRGGGIVYSTSGYVSWDRETVHKGSECPPPGRVVNMNRLGAALLGEVTDPPIRSLFVFGANPATSSPAAARIVRGMKRNDLFTIVHELFLTDTAELADLVLPATSQLEQTDLHKAYGTGVLTYNAPAIAAPGECRSNWEVMGLLAREMGFEEPWLHQSADEVIDEVLRATALENPHFETATLARLKRDGHAALNLGDDPPFADGVFPTPSGKVELYSQKLADLGLDPLPGRFDPRIDDGDVAGQENEWPGDEALSLLTGASHHFVSSSLASQAGLLQRAGPAFVEIHPEDAHRREIHDGDEVIVANGRGSCRLRAVVTDAVRKGVVVSPKGRWPRLSGGGNVNHTTTDALGDFAGQSTFHSTRVWIRKVE